MKLSSIIIFLIFAFLFSCHYDEWKTENKSIRPSFELSEKAYCASQFQEIKENQLTDHDFWTNMNHSTSEVAVEIKNGKLRLAEPKSVKLFYDLEDGKLEIINNGEFGGALNFIPTVNQLDTVSIWDVPINYVFNFENRVYFLVGIAHGMDSGGALFELQRKNGNFSYTEIIRLDSAPEAVSVYKNKILIAGHRMFTVIENFEKENIIQDAFWHSLYPNSIAIKNEDEVYIGMRGGYSKLSLKSKKIKYYKYKKELDC